MVVGDQQLRQKRYLSTGIPLNVIIFTTKSEFLQHLQFLDLPMLKLVK